MALKCAALADDKKGDNIRVLDVREVSGLTDYFVMVSGNSDPHVRAVAEEIERGLREEHSEKPHQVEKASQSWIVLDFFDVIVHVMREDLREKYDLEGLWGDAKKVPFEPAGNPAAS